MTTGDRVNLCGSLVALGGAVGFIVVYSLLAPWWRSRIGRLLVLKASVIVGLMSVPLAVYLLGVDAEAARMVRGILAGLFGVMMIYQTWLVCSSRDEEGD